MVGHYFEKYRAMATGVASCGSGVGTFVFAPLSVLLIENYGWKGAMWVIAGLALNGVVIGMLFRPLPNIADDASAAEEKKPLCDFSLLKKPAFLVFAVSSFLCMIGKTRN
jgi:predicted MFS family arabinose efflux permease